MALKSDLPPEIKSEDFFVIDESLLKKIELYRLCSFGKAKKYSNATVSHMINFRSYWLYSL
jgi:hypothetical protein